jgi:hypothetical protein
MTIVCPKCMRRSEDDETVCAKCGAILRSPTQPRGEAGTPGNAEAVNATGSLSSTGPNGSTSPADIAQVSTGTGNVTTNDDSAEAIRDALDYLESGSRKPKSPTTFAGSTAKPPRPDKQKWIITIGITALVILAIGLFFGLSGSSKNSAGDKGAATDTTVAKVLFQNTGSGTSTTGSFTTNAPFKFSYDLSCQPALAAPVAFMLLKDNTKVDEVMSNAGNTVEKGTHSGFGVSGVYTISVQAPTSCSWTISGSS